jgi:SpoVK/Ycf46/Vps4 family AAA+-type ATPase
VLPEAQSSSLQQIASQVQQRAKVYDNWGFAERTSRGLGISALFSGPSGTGKTLAAEVIAGALNLDLYRIDLSQVVSKYIGETEKNLRRIFQAAEGSGAVLLFDEADAIFGKRTEVKDSHDRYANIEVGYLLQRMEAYQGLVILTSNLKNSLDSAFLRRIRFVVQFPFPEIEHRLQIWASIFPSAMPRDDINLEQLAELSLAGGNIRNIAINAAFLAAAEDKAVSMDSLVRAARSEFAKLERPMSELDLGGTR